MRPRDLVLVLGWCTMSAAACGGGQDSRAIETVKKYNERLAEAYRTADVAPLRGIAGAEEGRKVAALIGVKLDQGITLDAQLLDFEVVAVRRRGEGVEVRTRERWYYADRRIGTGAQVGADSTDRYEVAYTVREESGGRVVALVEFVTEPILGRAETNHAPAGVVRGVETPNPAQEHIQPPPRQRPPERGAREAR